VQTACSTSLVAVHLACQAILAGECDMALAGAATIRVPQRVGYLSRRGDILSPDGHCRAFDAEAQGTIFGSGVGVVLLKELDAAIADRDNIYAVIRGSAVNNDGADKVSYTASNVAGQIRAMLEAMLVAEVSPDDIGYVECHGTGTIVGDPLEIDALARAFRASTERAGYCAIGSVKTNIGHLEQTAGIAALIKVALMLKNGKIPASLNFQTPNPKIDFGACPFFVNTKCCDWPADRPRLAAVNSLGLGGTNAFVVLEQTPYLAPETTADERRPHLFTLSAKTVEALDASIERHRCWLEDRPEADLSDICFTASSGRKHFAHRYATLVSSAGQLRMALAEELKKNRTGVDGMQAQGKRRRLAFLFSGQGSQHPGMAAELYRHEPVFRTVVDRCAELLRDRLERPLLEVLFAEDDGAGPIHETAYTQPALFTVQAALTQLLRSWGIVPDAVLGHSIGEFGAAFCAGVYTLDDALLLVAERARLMQSLPRTGAMAAIFADEDKVAASLGDAANVAVAAVNAPGNTVISGESEAVATLVAHFSTLGIASQLLNVSHAFHSPLTQPILDDFQRAAEAISTREPQITWVSSTSGTTLTRPPDAAYWRDHARKAVRFQLGIQTLAKLGIEDFMEIGPGSTLLALGRQCLDGPQAWLRSLGNKSRSDINEILTTLGKLYVHGYEVDWDRFNEPYRKSRISLPTYPFEHRRYWLEGDASARPRSSYPHEMSLTGQRIRSTLPQAQFETTYSLARFNYLGDHRIYGIPVLPLAAGLTALRGAARQHFGTDQVALANLQYREALVLPDDGERVVQSVLTPIDESTAEFSLASIEADAADGWRTHMVGMARKEDWSRRLSAELDEVRLRCANPVATELYYKTLHAIGLQYGPSFRAIVELRRGNGEALSRVRLPSHLRAVDTLHPALLDACLHLYPALIDDYGDFDRTPPQVGHTYLPISIERFRSSGPITNQVWVHGVRRSGQDDQQLITIDIAVYREDGSEAATLEGLSLKQLPPQALQPNARRTAPDWLYQLQWLERPRLSSPDRPSGEPTGWLILADRGGVGAALADLLANRGGVCRLVPFAEVAGSVCKRSWSPDILLKPLAALLAEFAQGSVSLRGVIDLWPLDVATSDLTLRELQESQKIVVGGALALFRAVVEGRSPDSEARIWLVSRNVISTSLDGVPGPVAAALWGVGRSAALEHPRNWGGLVDLEAREDPSPTSDAAELLRELLNGDGEDQVALRAGHRFAARIVRADVPPETTVPFDAEGSYLITGGLGALGVRVAEWLLTRHGAKHLLLVSRRGEEDPKAAQVLGALAVLGAEVVIRKTDITNERDVRALLAWIKSSARPLKGVFHCAGGLDDGILMQMDWQKFDRVAAPKIAGGWLLHQFTREFDLDHFVVFSSILSLIGSAGQANYAAANAFLDALVAHRRAKGLPALTFNWGPWDESGLATLSGDRGRAIWRARGTEYIPAELGQRALDLLAGSCAGHAAITLTQWPIFFRQFGKVPLVYSELQKETGSGTANDAALTDAISFPDRLNQAPNGERRELLIAFVRQHAMKTLGITDMIDASRPLRELGLDSLMSVTLVNRLESALGIRVSAVKLIQGPSVAQIVDDVLPQLNVGTEEARAATAPSSAAAAKGWLVTPAPRASPRVRLFCFPFAGGGSAVYHSWAQSLDPTIEVVAIEPPGRLGRINEQPIADIDEFVTELTTEMRDVLDRPFAFFGHCLGALTMYETARRLIHTTGSRPIHLFASGARPPDRILDLGRFEERLTQDLIKLAEFRIKLPPYAQPDDVFAELVRHFNIQATEQLLNNPELRQLMLPVVRAEFAMALNYDFVEEPAWDIPITCFAGLDDPYVTRDHALGWGRFTNSRLQVHIRQVAHFAVVDDVDFIHSVINRELRQEASDPVDKPEPQQHPRIFDRHHPLDSTNGCCRRVDSVDLNAATASRG
jgi:acyl transferase domain-containing protein/surfactin synthase thioesterase subunit/acyl carrier protein